MRTYHITVDHHQKVTLAEDPDCAPERRLLAAWVLGDLGLFRVDIAVIGPQSQETNDDLPLSNSKAEDICQAIYDLVMLLKQEPGGKDPAR